MALVRDPAFWRRFSVAVHQDDEAQAQNRPGLKHSYVHTLPPASPQLSTQSSVLSSPTLVEPRGPLDNASGHHQPGYMDYQPQRPTPSHYSDSTFHNFRSFLICATPEPQSPMPQSRPQSHRSHRHSHRQSRYLPPASPALASRPKRPPLPHTQPSSVRKPKPIYASTHTNRSTLTLALQFSGRPTSRFKFWTHVEANPSHRESWLEAQRRKKSRRTCMCWAFWLVLATVVACAVLTVLLLKSKGVI